MFAAANPQQRTYSEISNNELADVGRSKAVTKILNKLEKTAQNPDLETKVKHSAFAIINLGNKISKFLRISQYGKLNMEQHNQSVDWVNCTNFISSHSDSSAANSQADIGLVIGGKANHTYLKHFGGQGVPASKF
ncbi:hypothetical protein CVT25_005537 [Psilocybe cyanescens]|uniref:Uncharacterized protein n=1 Tax=Psilocybe cyanescens TaxID=93625 RepID=A0A409VQW0_PSICY|nr:hypothetical protein CVT25_005537 [Psilocybe cyanescens]